MRIVARVLIAAAALAFSSGCASSDWIDRTLVTVDVTGTWYGNIAGGVGSGGPSAIQLDLEQQGSTVKGFLRFPGGSGQPAGRYAAGPIDGTVAGDVFRFREPRGNVEGELTVSEDEMNGRATIFAGSLPLSLRRADPFSRPASPPR